MKLEIGADRAIMSYRILDPDIWPRRQDAEFSLSIIHALIARSLGDDWKPLSVEFEHAPARRRQVWNETLGTDCAFERPQNAIAIPLPALGSPMPAHNHSRWRRKSGHLVHALGLRKSAQPVRDRVASALFACLGKGPVDQQAVAGALAMSCRTIHRRLEAEGTRFSDVLADCRIRLALHALAHDVKPLAHIAEDLGYSDQSAFTRAFKQHCHMTPIAYRRRARAPAV
jgi:AraC-like DNA-binding protein